jgi:hypothetical protein
MTNWASKAPPYDSQYSGVTHTDVQDCTCESLAHLVFFLTRWWVSPRALAIAARVDLPENRNASHVLAVANAVGFTDYSNCPTPDSFTMQSYYSFDISKLPMRKLDITLIPSNINLSPFWEELDWGLNLAQPTRHLVVGVDTNGNYFDSEPGNALKNINNPSTLGASPAKIMWQSSIRINKPPYMVIPKRVVKKDGITFGVLLDTPNGAQIIYATDENQWRSWNDADSYQLPTVDDNGKTIWEADIQLPF